MTQVEGNSMYLNRCFTGILGKIAKTFATGTEFALACLKCFVTAKKRETIVIRRRSPRTVKKSGATVAQAQIAAPYGKNGQRGNDRTEKTVSRRHHEEQTIM
jgi:hypothetical protein